MTGTKNHATDYCPAEIMAAFMCRNLKGFDSTGMGGFSLVPWVAIRLAQSPTSTLWSQSVTFAASAP